MISKQVRQYLSTLSDGEKSELRNWIAEILTIYESSNSRFLKLKGIGALAKNSKSLMPVLRQLYYDLKKHSWDNRGGATRSFSAVALGTVLVFGFQGIGLAAFGGAIGLPLWVVFGGGASAAYAILADLSGKR